MEDPKIVGVNEAKEGHEAVGVVYLQRVSKEGAESLQIEVSYRDKQQSLPYEAVSFKNMEEMTEAIKTLAKSNGWDIPQDFPFEKVWEDASSGIGWDFHPSNKNETITLPDGNKVVVFRHEINSAI